MSGIITSTVVAAAAKVLPVLARQAITKARWRKITASAESMLVAGGAERFLEHLDAAQLRRLEHFVKSAEFDHLMLKALVCDASGGKDEDTSLVREQLRLALQRGEVFAGGDLVQATDALLELLFSSVHAVRREAPGVLDHGRAVASAAQIAAAGARNCQLLSQVGSLNEINDFARKMRGQTKQLHGKLKLPNVAQSRSVAYSQLYVAPTLMEKFDDSGKAESWDLDKLMNRRLRTVILGDPGAGKSTLAGKFVHDVSTGKFEALQDHVPLLLVVREHTQSLRTDHQTLLHYLEAACRRPYGVTLPAEGLEYLLLNGRAVVVIDGVDELGESRFRERFMQLVEGFANLYPLTRIIVTSRVVGYQDAPLDEALFPVLRVAPFDETQVGQYSRFWFKLDKSISKDERDKLANSFLNESFKDANDIRTNPLMLSLLCVLYSSEGFIPHNRPAIYEKCAELLFDMWDRLRGIPVPHHYRLHQAIRPAASLATIY